MSASWEIHRRDALERLREMVPESVQCCITSPPYFGLRDYGQEGQIGLEPTPDAYVAKLVEVFREVKRVLRDDGTLWLNLGDSYNNRSRYRPSSHQPGLNGVVDSTWRQDSARGRCRPSIIGDDLKEKDLLGIPWMVAFALRTDGWYLRSEIIWAKPNPMPESVTDRPTKAHETVFLLSKSARYYYDAASVAEPVTHGERFHGSYSAPTPTGPQRTSARNGRADVENFVSARNKRSVWTVATQPYPEAHFATFPPKLVEPMVLAGCPAGGTVLDPFCGSGTTLKVAVERGRNAIGIELNADYCVLAKQRLYGLTAPLFA